MLDKNCSFDELIFISAQPDITYFHWQVELYLYNFTQKGIPKKQCFAIFAIKDKPSHYLINLKKNYPGIYWYLDERDKNIDYISSVRPHILKKFFAQFPHYGKAVFYHDSDILFNQLPPFKTLLNGVDCYLSDTIDYIGYNYIKSTCDHYKEAYPELSDTHLLEQMAQCLNISTKTLKKNEKNSGGAQYLLKNINADFWRTVEVDCINLYELMHNYTKKYPIDNAIQKWTADMWAVLWNLWKLGKKTIVHPELSFSWATFDCSHEENGYYSHNIFHLAGVTKEFVKKHPDFFFKGDFTSKNIIELLKTDINYFDYVDRNNSSGKYIENAINYVCEKYKLSHIKHKQGLANTQNKIAQHVSISIKPNHSFSIDYPEIKGLYYKSNHRLCGQAIWCCDDKRKIIFYNHDLWILTDLKYLSELNSTSGGYYSSEPTGQPPYFAQWPKNWGVAIEADELLLKCSADITGAISGIYKRLEAEKNGKNLWENIEQRKILMYSIDRWIITEKDYYFGTSRWKYCYLSSLGKNVTEPYKDLWVDKVS